MENQNMPPLPPQTDTPIRPKNWLVESILVTILCCLPFGIVGIINASKVNSLYDQGLYDESIRSSANAKKWTMIGLIIGVVYLIFVIVMVSMGAFTGMNMPGASSLSF